mmetsp:Transcript_50615/g.123409  ORF Transcript_50615/g.123409 Transcript_50615/m.123409 type:complete len:223 (-) Transcript_50615:360-1028(-)
MGLQLFDDERILHARQERRCETNFDPSRECKEVAKACPPLLNRDLFLRVDGRLGPESHNVAVYRLNQIQEDLDGHLMPHVGRVPLAKHLRPALRKNPFQLVHPVHHTCSIDTAVAVGIHYLGNIGDRRVRIQCSRGNRGKELIVGGVVLDRRPLEQPLLLPPLARLGLLQLLLVRLRHDLLHPALLLLVRGVAPLLNHLLVLREPLPAAHARVLLVQLPLLV